MWLNVKFFAMTINENKNYLILRFRKTEIDVK